MKKIFTIFVVILFIASITGCKQKSKVNNNDYSRDEPVKQEINITWQKRFEGKFAAVAASIQQTNDSGYVVAGGTCGLDSYYLYRAENYDAYILKLDSHGNIEWEKIYGGKRVDFIHSIQQTKDNGYICAGYTGSFDNPKKGESWHYDAYVLKLDSNGNLEWEKAYGGNYCDSAYYIKQTKDDGYIVAGTLDITEEDRKGYAGILKLDSKGNLEWQIKLKGKGSSADCVLQTNDGGYIVAGGEDIVRQDYKGDEDYKKIKSVMYILKL